jgi:hypothetical protein
LSSSYEKTQQLLFALHFLKQAYQISPQNFSNQQQMWELGLTLIRLGCEQREYIFARYIAAQIEILEAIPLEKTSPPLPLYRKICAFSERAYSQTF